MGFFRDSRGVRCYEPDDSEHIFFIRTTDESYNIQEIIDKSNEKFGQDVSLSDLYIESHYFQTDCIGYDCYDSSDYNNYISVTYKKKYQI